jgi:hypothetical protein
MAENEALGATRLQLLRAGVVETLQQIANTIAAMDEGAFEDIESRLRTCVGALADCLKRE